MRISSFFRQFMALVVGCVSVFVVTGCQGEDTPAPVPSLPQTGAPPAPTKAQPLAGKAAGSGTAGARQPRFGDPSPAK